MSNHKEQKRERKFWIVKIKERDGNIPPEYKIVETNKRPKNAVFQSKDQYYESKNTAEVQMNYILNEIFSSCDGTRFD